MRRRNARTRAVIVTAAALSFLLAGSAVAVADTGDASDGQDSSDKVTDRPIHRITDRHTDRPKDRPTDRPRDRVTDRPDDRPTDRPTDRPDPRRHQCDRDRAADRPADCPDHDRRSIWKRCLEAAQSDTTIDDPELAKICHRLLWKHNAWKRCLNWAEEHTDLQIENRHELWRLCHRHFWRQANAD